jgi:G3E family GTPase
MTFTLCLALLGALVAPPRWTQAPSKSAGARTLLRMSGGAAPVAESAPASTIQKPIPVTILSGFLGAGKTTLLSHLLKNTEGYKIGVIVNDVAAVNVDAKLMRDAEQGQGAGKLDMIELSNGCACCSAGDDLFGAMAELVSNCMMRGELYDHIVFEASGVAEPKLLRAAFQEAGQSGWPLMRHVRLENMVTVVDATNFLELYASTEKVSERADLGGDELLKDEPGLEVWALPEELPPTPSVVQLLIEQVETADVLVLNKVDGVDAAGLAYLSDALGHINGFATLLPAKFGNVAPSQVLVGEREAGVALSNEVIDEPAPIEL